MSKKRPEPWQSIDVDTAVMVINLDTETVEAISVKWLREWFSFHQWLGSTMGNKFCCEASDIINDWYEEQKRKQWEKENEG